MCDRHPDQQDDKYAHLNPEDDIFDHEEDFDEQQERERGRIEQLRDAKREEGFHKSNLEKYFDTQKNQQDRIKGDNLDMELRILANKWTLKNL